MISNLKKFYSNYYPSIILLGIIANHIYLLNTSKMSPWLRGGYGMFSRIEVRFPIIKYKLNQNDSFKVLEYDKKSFNILVDSLNEGDFGSIVDFPTNRNLSRFIDKVLNQKFIQSGDTIKLVPNYSLEFKVGSSNNHLESVKSYGSNFGLAQFHAVNIEIWKLNIKLKKYEKLNEYTKTLR